MREAFRRRGLPGQDPEADDVLTGVTALTDRGVADPRALILLGHSYGGYLAGRMIARDHRFSAAVCCETVADLRLLDPVSRRMQQSWLGGGPGRVPERWDAASLTGQVGQIRTPVLLVYAADGRLSAQGQAWRRALTAAGADHKLIMVPGAGHLFASRPAQRQLHQAVLDWCARPGSRRPPGPRG